MKHRIEIWCQHEISIRTMNRTGLVSVPASNRIEQSSTICAIARMSGCFVLDALKQTLHDPRLGYSSGFAHPSAQTHNMSDQVGRARARDDQRPLQGHDDLPTSPWGSVERAEPVRPEWIGRFDNKRLLVPIGSIPPAEIEARDQAPNGRHRCII